MADFGNKHNHFEVYSIRIKDFLSLCAVRMVATSGLEPLTPGL